jgi:hypothetical protein
MPKNVLIKNTPPTLAGFSSIHQHSEINTRCAWAGGTYAVFLDFCVHDFKD